MRASIPEPIDYSNLTLEEVKETLRTQQVYLDYYAQFDPTSIEDFIDVYAPKKIQMLQNRESYKSGVEYFKIRFIQLADNYIDTILQKKLFNLQCEWRAGLISLPLVRTSRDFKYWAKHIRACPFIPIITPEEVDLCIRFLQEEYDFYQDATIIGNKWQDYEEFKYSELEDEEYDEGDEEDEQASLSTSSLPPLYLYFDTYQNTSGLINLPDVRGEKEEMYLNIYRDLQRWEKERLEAEKAKEETPTEPSPPREPYRPRLFWGEENIKSFVEVVENQEVKDAHAYYYDNFQFYRDYEFEECLMYLRDFPEPFPIEAHKDWREAIRLMLLKQTQLKAAEMLPYVYETYLLEFEKPYNFKKIMADKIARYPIDPDDTYYKTATAYKEWITIGRKALQGDDDVDYLA
jgi:hypothetical protein